MPLDPNPAMPNPSAFPDHEFAEHGFLRHSETGHLVGIEQKPHPVAKEVVEFPKWVVPHDTHVSRDAHGHVSVPLFPGHHVGRDGVVTVMVKDADEEAKALAARE